MANQNATMAKQENLEESLDFDELERKLQEELDIRVSELAFLQEQKEQIGNPEALGNVIMETVWEQFTNQIAVIAGEDFIKANNSLKLDLRNEAHIQTTENFSKGKIATHNREIDYQKRYDDWQGNFKRDENGDILMRWDNRAGEDKAVLKDDARDDFDKGRPKGSKTVNKDHDISVAEIVRDPAVNAHLTRREQIEFANSDVNLMDLDASANQSKKDSTMEEWLDWERNGQKPAERFDIDEEKLREQDKVARKEYEKLKKEGEKSSIRAGKKSQQDEAFRITGKAARVIVMQLLADLIKNIIGKFVLWLKNSGKTLSSLLDSMKNAILSFVANLKRNLINAGNAAVTVIATSILGPVVSTIKKSWMLIKQGWISLKEAVAYIRDSRNKNKPIGTLMLEVGKIVIAGLSSVSAIVLSEVIEKGLMTIPLFAVEIPFLGSLANIIGIFMAAVVSGIIGALAINLIDRLISKKQKAEITGLQVQKGNEILCTQHDILEINKSKLAKSMTDATQNIKDRHEKAASIMKSTLESIVSERENRNDDAFDRMNAMLTKMRK